MFDGTTSRNCHTAIFASFMDFLAWSRHLSVAGVPRQGAPQLKVPRAMNGGKVRTSVFDGISSVEL